jgi:alkylation response protein AidB-like acyl-CoA dehydrogenase
MEALAMVDFNFNEDQQLLKTNARDFVKRECTSDFVRKMEEDEKGYTDELWEQMAELGWMGLLIPDAYEGIGWTVLDLVVIMEELGVGCVPGPYLSTVLGSVAVAEGGKQAVKEALLPEISMGEKVLTLAYLEPGSTKYDPSMVAVTAQKDGDGFVLNGKKMFVQDAHVADYLVVSARTSGDTVSEEGVSLFLVPKDAGIKLDKLKTVAADKQFVVTLDNVKVSADALLGDLDKGFGILDRVLQIGAVAKCAEMVGGSARVLDITVEYAKDREQFGQPIGKFQAVQHLCSNMEIDLKGSRYITYKAAWKMSEGLTAELEICSAKGFINKACRRICANGHQIGAATAYMVEHDLPLYSRRARAGEVLYGDTAYYQERIAGVLGL